MYIEPIDDAAAQAALPRRAPAAKGVFAWGRAKSGRSRIALAWTEFAIIFALLPLCALAFGAGAAPLTAGAALTTAVILLSVTRGFHWRDLIPVDPLSEAPFFAGCAVALAGGAFLATAIAAPGALFSAPERSVAFMVGFPLLAALPFELIHRALLFRRYGRLFRSEGRAIVAGAAANALFYGAMSGSLGGAAFGAALGLLLGWAYLKTGQFALCVLLHWIAALSVSLIGPGL